MTDLIQRLRDVEYRFTGAICDELRIEAADALEAQAKEIERLRSLLRIVRTYLTGSTKCDREDEYTVGVIDAALARKNK